MGRGNPGERVLRARGIGYWYGRNTRVILGEREEEEKDQRKKNCREKRIL
jgi:hypothetical protein